MEPPRPPTRREFIRGRAARDPLPAAAAEATADAATVDVAETPYLVRYARQAMACDFQLLLAAGRDDAGCAAAAAAFDLIETLESQLTVYRATSDVLEINRRAADEPVAVEPQLFDLLARAVEWGRAVDGALDITSGPLSRAWGFSRREGRIPNDDELRRAAVAVGLDKLVLDPTAKTIRFTQPGVEINLNAVGKGYALDRAAEALAAHGIGNFLLHGGGSSVLARGSSQRVPTGETTGGWTVGVGHPLHAGRRLAELHIVDRTVGTSGAGFQFFRRDGKRYGHILDPRTARPADGVFSVSVVAPSAAEADALSTAFYVLGPERAERYCATRGDVGFLMLVPSARGSSIELITCGLADDAWRLVERTER